MSKLITFAGISRVNGELKFRTAASDARFLQLTKLGDTDIEFSNVNAETKADAAKQLLSRNFANGRADIDALLNSVASEVAVVRAPKTVKTKTVKVKNVVVKPVVVDDAPMSAKQAAKIRAEFMKKLAKAYEAN